MYHLIQIYHIYSTGWKDDFAEEEINKQTNKKKRQQVKRDAQQPCILTIAMEALLSFLALKKTQSLRNYCAVVSLLWRKREQEQTCTHTKAWLAQIKALFYQIALRNGASSFLFTLNSSSLRFHFAYAQAGERKITTEFLWPPLPQRIKEMIKMKSWFLKKLYCFQKS